MQISRTCRWVGGPRPFAICVVFENTARDDREPDLPSPVRVGSMCVLERLTALHRSSHRVKSFDQRPSLFSSLDFESERRDFQKLAPRRAIETRLEVGSRRRASPSRMLKSSSVSSIACQ